MAFGITVFIVPVMVLGLVIFLLGRDENDYKGWLKDWLKNKRK